MNRLLTNKDREDFKPLINAMFKSCPQMMARKIKEANVQQAFVIQTVLYTFHELGFDKQPNGINILCVGSFEDTACEHLKSLGLTMTEIDPLINVDLHTFKESVTETYDIIFSTSVLEHVENDELFITDICRLLTVDGTAILTCDFKEGWSAGDPVHPADCRFYTEYDLAVRLNKIIQSCGCELVSKPEWKGQPDFSCGGHEYNFATLVFKRIK